MVFQETTNIESKKKIKKLKILIACEESQIVTKAFRSKGVEAFSCDILPCSGGRPEWHIQDDVILLLKKSWDMIIAFPPCTHLCSSGAQYWSEKQKDGRQEKAFSFVLKIYYSNCKHIAIENPVGILSTIWKKPSQIIQPYNFGDPYMKKTCLWLKGLPLLKNTDVVKPLAHWSSGSMRAGKRKDGTRKKTELKLLHRNSKLRSKFHKGIAEAMADQWI